MKDFYFKELNEIFKNLKKIVHLLYSKKDKKKKFLYQKLKSKIKFSHRKFYLEVDNPSISPKKKKLKLFLIYY